MSLRACSASLGCLTISAVDTAAPSALPAASPSRIWMLSSTPAASPRPPRPTCLRVAACACRCRRGFVCHERPQPQLACTPCILQGCRQHIQPRTGIASSAAALDISSLPRVLRILCKQRHVVTARWHYCLQGSRSGKLCCLSVQ